MPKKKEVKSPKVKSDKLSDDFALVKKLISKLLKEPPKSWAHQVKLMKGLLDEFPSKEFWLWMKPYKEIDSLVYYLNDFCKKDLKKQYSMFLRESITPTVAPLIGEEKVGEDIVIVKRKKTISELLAD